VLFVEINAKIKKDSKTCGQKYLSMNIHTDFNLQRFGGFIFTPGTTVEIKAISSTMEYQ